MAGPEPGRATEDALEHVEVSDPRMLDVQLRVVSLQSTFPKEWTGDFKRVLGPEAKVTFGMRPQLESIYREMGGSVSRGPARVSSNQTTPKPKSAARADAVTVGDSWLQYCISESLISPFPGAENASWFRRLDPAWSGLLRRDSKGFPDPAGPVWAAPYRFGCTMIAYDKRKLSRIGAAVEDWTDLFLPTLRGRVGMGRSSREAVGVVLKSLGKSYVLSA